MHSHLFRLAAALGALWLLAACSPGSSPELNVDSASAPYPWLELKTTNARYRVIIADSYEHVPAGQMHYWDIQVLTIDEQPLTPKQFKVSGTMPGHGHGMATFPQAVALEQPGLMRVKGMKFHMSGEWRMRIDVNDDAGPDYTYFNFVVSPAPAKRVTSVSFTAEELAELNALRLSSLPPLQPDPSNRLSGNAKAVTLGEALFFDPGLSRSGTVSCATCHDPEKGFADGKVLSVGTATTPRHAPTLLGVAHASWFYWDGRRDSLWAQALSPLETRGEMDNARGDVVRYVLSNPDYSERFQRLTGISKDLLTALDTPGTGPLSDESGREAWRRLRPPVQERVNSAFAHVGKILAAYEETLHHTPSRFDAFADALLAGNDERIAELYTDAEQRGAKLYINDEKTPCLRCHNGPLLTNQEFHNIDTGHNAQGGFDSGREAGMLALRADPFNCYGVFSDAQRDQCTALSYGRGNHLDAGAFKTPSLRNIVNTAPYFHDGRMPSLEAVVAHYLASEGDEDDTHEMPEFSLTTEETQDLIAFLKTL